MLGVTRDRFLSCSRRKRFDEPQERREIVISNYLVGSGIRLVRPQDSFRHYQCFAAFLMAMEKSKGAEIARRPATQFPESLELSLILPTPPGRIGRLIGCL